MTDTGEAAGEIVSTHDLTKRSTSSGLRLISYNQRFNSRPHEEVDPHPLVVRPFCLLFQLTTSRRGRHPSTQPWATYKCFNSRPHEEVDRSYSETFSYPSYVSTHDLTKRSTAACERMVLHRRVSTHDLTKRSTFKRNGLVMQREGVSTHDLTKRSTIDIALLIGLGIVSTHDLTKRSTMLNYEVLANIYVSTHDLTKRSTVN